MTHTRSYVPFDDTISPLWDEAVTTFTDTRVVYTVGELKMVITGTGFSFSPDGFEMLTGTIQSMRFYDGDVLQHRILDIGMTIQEINDGATSLLDAFRNIYSGNDTIIGSSGNDTLYGFGGDDMIKGGRGRDVLFGGNGDDTLKGGLGRDKLKGGQGDDTLIGGFGNDKLIGGAGHDVFVFATNSKQDQIMDFTDGIDFLDLRGFNFASTDDVLNNTTSNGTDTIIDFGNGDVLTLRDFDIADFGSADFII